jgi:hypothetical protein
MANFNFSFKNHDLWMTVRESFASVTDPLTFYDYEYQTAEPDEESCRLINILCGKLEYV